MATNTVSSSVLRIRPAPSNISNSSSTAMQMYLLIEDHPTNMWYCTGTMSNDSLYTDSDHWETLVSARTDDGYSEVTDQAAFLLEEKCVPIEEVHVLQSDMLLGRENEELRGKDDDLASGNQQGNKEESLSVEDQLKSTANNEGDIVLNGVMEHNHREGLNNKTVSVSKEFTETTGRSNITPVVMALIESQRQSTPAHNLINSCSKNHDTCATDSDHSHCSSVPQSCPTPSIATTCQRHIFFEDNNATLKIPLKKIAFPHDADTVNCLKNMRPFDIILERTPPKSSQSGTINVFHSKMLTLPAAKGQKGQPVQRGKTKRRRSSRTSSQSSSHHATEGDYHCSGAHASSGVGHTSSPPSKSSSPRKRRRRRAQSEDQYNSDSRLICILCGLHDNAQGLGYLYGPYKCLLSSSPHDDEGALNGDQSNGVWLHQDCAVWAPGVCLLGAELRGLSEAVQEGTEHNCSACRVSGATVDCHQYGCNSVYHYACARDNGCQFVWEQFFMFCAKHKRQ